MHSDEARVEISPLPGPLARRLDRVLADREAQGLLRERTVCRGPEKPGNGVLFLRSNDYLNLAKDPQVIAGARQALESFGASASASPLAGGYLEIHRQLETLLAHWHGYPFCLLMVSGFAANRSVMSQLPRTGDLVLADRLVHHSILSGILASGATLQRFAHNDLDRLEELLSAIRENGSEGAQVFVVTESVFSMDGDGPDLHRLLELRRKYGFFLVLDEAHGIGWYGPSGAGMLEDLGLQGQADVVVGTLGKALGSQGAYILARDRRVIDHLVNFAGDYIYSTFVAPAAAGAAIAAQKRITELGAERPAWQAMSRAWRSRLQELGLKPNAGRGPILSVVLEDPVKTMHVAQELAKEQIFVSGIRPPTVPPGASRLRLSLHRGLKEDDLDRFCRALKSLL